jgi:2-polyprenyl-6-methoxyphenol hydroxylase-like FAD-dependent oxidoreductase
VEVGDGSARTADGRDFRADLVVGADGARSTVRRWVSPERPDAIYAGILLWRAMLAEHELPPSVPWLRADEPSREYYSGPYRLVTYLVPGADGSSEPGRRRLNLVWYDPARSELLEDHGLLEGTTIYGSLAAGDVPEAIRHDLEAAASKRWPTPWRQALEIALERSLVFATPVVQYRPDRLYKGRVALAGDAAHAASPMVGGGFRHGLYDVAPLSAAFDNDGTLHVSPILDSYGHQRLASAQAHVEQSQAAGQQYLERQGRR